MLRKPHIPLRRTETAQFSPQIRGRQAWILRDMQNGGSERLVQVTDVLQYARTGPRPGRLGDRRDPLRYIYDGWSRSITAASRDIGAFR